MQVQSVAGGSGIEAQKDASQHTVAQVQGEHKNKAEQNMNIRTSEKNEQSDQCKCVKMLRISDRHRLPLLLQFDFRLGSRDARFCPLERRPSLFLLPQHRNCGWLAWSRRMESLLDALLLVPASLLFLGGFDRILQFPRG
jgi:hypothetical protein